MAVESDGQAVRQQVERILKSPGFVRNERLSQFVRFVVERHLEGGDHELKECSIGVEVFGRRPDYDPKHDPIVRTEAARLRARLAEYYLGQGKDDPLTIDVPKGGYIPRIRGRETTADRPRAGPKWFWLALAVGVAGFTIAVGLGWWRAQRNREPIAIAVLPFENRNHEPGDDYFADGLTDETIRQLSIIEGLAVRSQTSSFAFKGKPRNMRDAGKQLAAEYILEGSVVHAGQQVRINARLVRAHDDFPVWSDRYDRQLMDILAIQDEICRGIVNSLRLKLGRGRRRYETNAAVYDLYLRARALPIQHGLSGYDESIAAFEEAVAKDPSFAPAYAGLAIAHTVRSGQFRFLPADELNKMRAAAGKAIELDPLSAEAQEAVAMVHARDAQWAQSAASFRRAIQLDPNHSRSYVNFAMSVLFPLGRLKEALRQLRVAQKNDPLSPEICQTLAFVLISSGRHEEAARLCENLPAGFSLKSDCLGRVRLWQGRTSEAIQFLATAYDQGYLGYAYARAGRVEEAEKLAAVLSSDPIQQALIFAGLGDRVRTLDALDRASALGPGRIGRLLNYPEMTLIRGDPRLGAIRKKLGLSQ
ncbi:MAG: hypothetical protein IT167_18780 [Bryobacterales bacterium]|nr:hypothetical protein [Bryobacterales bacterium]